MSFTSNSTAFEVKLLILSLVLVAVASCKSGEGALNSNSIAASANRSHLASSVPTKATPSCVNLNGATPADLIKLPGIGEVMAKRIIDYRERHGRFRRTEELIIIEGFSENKYRTIASLICVE
jgi:competence ComEA-like helix-hairpin-helix protein